MNDVPEKKDQGKGMREGHFLDLKLPIGWLLSAYGLLLLVYGLLAKKEIYARSLGVNVNAVWGGLMLVIGAGFLIVALVKRSRKKA